MMERRQQVLEKAMVLFSTKGYENTSMKDIAQAAQIAHSEIYQVFSHKADILEEIYTLYEAVILKQEPTPEEYIPVLLTGTLEDILNIFAFDLPEPRELHFLAIKIVVSRVFTDSRAKELYMRNQWENALAYIHEVIQKGIELGRLDMTYNEVAAFAHLVRSSREYSLNMASILPEQNTWKRIEPELVRYLASLIRLREAEPIPREVGMEMDMKHREMIHRTALAVGRYYHYSARLKRRGEWVLARFIDEITENILDELDALYTCAEQNEPEFSSQAIVRWIASNERANRIEAERMNTAQGAPVEDILIDIAELAQQHERVCNSIIEKLLQQQKKMSE